MSVAKFWKARKTVVQVTAILVVLVSSAVWAGTSRATPGSEVTAQLLGSGRLADPVRVKIKDGSRADIDVSQILTYKITIAPGGVTGWHQHGGPHMIIVASGTLTYYRADDPSCTGVKYPAGSSILDPGFDTHFVKNEGAVEAVTYVTQLLPEGGVFRIDAPAPENCAP